MLIGCRRALVSRRPGCWRPRAAAALAAGAPRSRSAAHPGCASHPRPGRDLDLCEVERLLSLLQCRRELQTARLGRLGLGLGMTHELENSPPAARGCRRPQRRWHPGSSRAGASERRGTKNHFAVSIDRRTETRPGPCPPYSAASVTAGKNVRNATPAGGSGPFSANRSSNAASTSTRAAVKRHRRSGDAATRASTRATRVSVGCVGRSCTA